MIFSLLIYASQATGQSEQTALRFARSVLSQGHQLHRIFFYGEGVTTASNTRIIPRDETNLSLQWLELADAHSLDVVICIAAAVKHGILDKNEAKRHNKPAANLEQGFTLSGLGQLADAIIQSDRVITFG